jgi:hypothetical protein
MVNTLRGPKIGSIDDVAKAVQLAEADHANGLGRTVLFVGAGCSVSAGIPLVSEIAPDLVVRLARKMKAPLEALTDPQSALHWLSIHSHIPTSGIRDIDTLTFDAINVDWPRIYDSLFSDHAITPNEVRDIFSDIIEKAMKALSLAKILKAYNAIARLLVVMAQSKGERSRVRSCKASR